MSGTWWVSHQDLDSDQRDVIALPLHESVLVTGPPGSGKTNLLLLRANYLSLSGQKNIAIITFTRALREFIAHGSAQYDFPPSKIMTFNEWGMDLLKQYGHHIQMSGDFKQDQAKLCTAVDTLVDAETLNKSIDAIFIDEAQDYSPQEIHLFNKIAKLLFCVADERQKIYDRESSIASITAIVNSCRKLHYHYRNGINICKVADKIVKKTNDNGLLSTCNYKEKNNPSIVFYKNYDSVKDQVEEILSRLDTQLGAFPNELIGIFCPKIETMEYVWSIIEKSTYSYLACLLHGTPKEGSLQKKQVIVSTFHSAKGLEFRAVHLVACDELKKMPSNRNIIFTAVTRAKTSLSVYYSGNNIHPYFEAALHSLKNEQEAPNIIDVFGGLK